MKYLSQIKPLAIKCKGIQDYSGKWYFTEENFERFAQACYQQGREDMHSEVMEVYQGHDVYDRLKELK